MSGAPTGPSETITDRRQLVEYFAGGNKPRENWLIGTEHEKFAYRLSDLRPLDYEGPQGIRALLMGMTRFGWDPEMENGNPIALKRSDGASVSLEPAGQVELSGAPLRTIHQTCTEVSEHLKQVKAIARDMKIGFLGLGYQPKWPRSDMPWMPKGRYKIMRDYMPKRGTLGLDMMQSTCRADLDSFRATMVCSRRAGLTVAPRLF